MPAYIRYPPSQPPGKLPELIVDKITEGWRIHDEPNPYAPRRRPSGKWRFDAPDGSWQVTYVNLTQVGAFAEVYAKRRDIGPGEADRRLSKVSSKPLRVIALDDPAVLASFRLDALVNVVPTYGRTMRWGARLREWYDGSNGELAHGIRYVGRKSASHLNYCLWLDRCPGLLRFSEHGKLGALRREVMLAADQLQLTTRLFDPTPSPPNAWPGR